MGARAWRTSDVLIAGAGPAGLVLACDLARRGVASASSRPIPRRRTTAPARAARASSRARWKSMTISASSSEVHEAGGRIIRRWRGTGRSRSGRRNFTASKSASRRPTCPIPACGCCCSRARSTSCARDCGAWRPGRVRHQARQRFSQDADGVTASLQHADGRAETLRARYLAGCDGARGVVRAGSAWSSPARPSTRIR